MAWIESHQDLATNRKTKRAARMLDVPVPQVIGHLHMLWWWSLDHAFNGDLSDFDAWDIADAAGWDGDPDDFVEALKQCGPGDKSGFLNNGDGRLTINDWDQFTEHLRARREASAKAHHERWHVSRDVVEPSCELCADADGSQSDGYANAERTQDERTAPEPEPTEPTEQETGPDFESEFWQRYPKRDGKRLNKRKAKDQWKKLDVDERRHAVATLENFGKAAANPDVFCPIPDAFRWLRDRQFEEWDEPAKPGETGRSPPSRVRACELCGRGRGSSEGSSHWEDCPQHPDSEDAA